MHFFSPFFEKQNLRKKFIYVMLLMYIYFIPAQI